MRYSAAMLGGLTAMILCAATPAFSERRGDPKNDDRVEEDVAGRPDLVKVTHIYRHGKGKPAAAAPCACPGTDGSNYSLEKVKWTVPEVKFNIYTVNSKLGAGAGDAVKAAFNVWKAADAAAPTPVVTAQNDAAAGPGIGLDAEQNVSWQPLSGVYGANTLAVTVYWYSRAKVGGFSSIAHFDMAFSTDYNWGLLGATESCGAGTLFDVQAVGTHEAGHAYGMGHNNDCNMTMNPTAAPGETTKSTLATGDIRGIKAIY